MSLGVLVSLFKLFSKDLATSVAADGVKGLFTYRKRRREEKRAQDQYERIIHIESLAERFAEDPSQKVRNLADTLSPLIADLHVKSCHEALSKLRQEVTVDDQRSLSRIDFYLGCCSRHVNHEQCKAEYERAYNEMIGAKVYDNDIVAARIFLQCRKRDSQAALQAAEGLKQHDRNNIWAWVPGLMFADNLTEAYQALPSEIDAKIVLATASMLGTKEESFGVDLQTYKVVLPTGITYENIAEWVFGLSILVTRYINEWNFTAFLSDDQPGPACKAFNEAVTTFNSLSAKTQLGDFVKGINLWYLMSRYQMTHDAALLDEIKTCPCEGKFKVHRILAYANFLAKADRFEDAKAYLVEQNLPADVSLINNRLLLALQTADADYVAATLKDATDNAVSFNLVQVVYLLQAVRNFPEQAKPYTAKLVFPEGKDYDACRMMVLHFVGEPVDESFLLENRNELNAVIAPFVALVLHDKGHTEEAIALCEQTIQQDIVDLRTFVYVGILEKTPQHTDKLYKFLGDLRRSGFLLHTPFLVKEYSLAVRVKDTTNMLEISGLLHSQHPDNASYFACYISAAATCHDFDKVKELATEISKYQFEVSEAGQIYNVLIASGLHEDALSFLYGYIKSHPANEGLNMLFQSASVNPYTGAIVNREYDTVFDGAYVRFLHNGESQAAEVTSTTRLKILIGKSKGDEVEDTDRMNRKDVYVIQSIHNRYRQLVEEIFRGIGEGNYDSAVSYHFTDEEMQGGNIFEVFNRMVGHDADWFQQHNDNLQKYKQGELPLGVFLHNDDLVASLYEHLFGTFKVYNMVHQEFDKLFEIKRVDVDQMTYVLDMSSLIMLFELQQRFSLVYQKKFIVPQGVVQMVNAALIKEQNGTPSFISQHVGELLTEIGQPEGEHWMVTRLRTLITWIEQYAEVEVATEILNVDDKGAFSRSEYIALFYESVMLATRGGRVVLTMDQNLVRMMVALVPMMDVNAYLCHFFRSEYTDICRFFMQANIFGGEIDTQFAFSEYNKFAVGQQSLFKNCQENLTLSPVSYTQVIDLCFEISRRAVLLDIDLLMIESLFHDMFALFDHHYAGIVLRLILAKTQDPVLRKRAQSAFHIVHPLY